MNRVAYGRIGLSSMLASLALLAASGACVTVRDRREEAAYEAIDSLRRRFAPPKKRLNFGRHFVRFLGRPDNQPVFGAKPHLQGLCRRRLFNRSSHAWQRTTVLETP